MANNYYGYQKKSGNGWKVFGIIVAILLVAVLVVSLVVTYRTTNGWKEMPEFDDEVIEDDVDDENISEIDVEVGDEVGGISLLVADVDPLWSGNKAKTITVSYNKDATDPLFVWEIIEGVGQTVTITPSDDTLSCTVSCNGGFDTQVVIMCSYYYDLDIYATCTVDCYSSCENITFNFGAGDVICYEFDPEVDGYDGNESTCVPESVLLPPFEDQYGDAYYNLPMTLEIGTVTSDLYTIYQDYEIVGWDLYYGINSYRRMTLRASSENVPSCYGELVWWCMGNASATYSYEKLQKQASTAYMIFSSYSSAQAFFVFDIYVQESIAGGVYQYSLYFNFDVSYISVLVNNVELSDSALYF